jgi:hypothetical protein
MDILLTWEQRHLTYPYNIVQYSQLVNVDNREGGREGGEGTKEHFSNITNWRIIGGRNRRKFKIKTWTERGSRDLL